MHIMKRLCLFSGLGLLTLSSAMAGLSLDNTRIIFLGSATRVSIGVSSSDSSMTPYLVKAQVFQDSAGHDANVPFVLSPSLFRLDIGNTQTVLILKKNINLPKDKESVFYFNALAIPAQNSADKQEIAPVDGSLQIASSIVVKLFYRPNNLSMNPKEAMGKLQFTSTAEGVAVRNPTPYFITLDSLRVNGQAISLSTKAKISSGMIAPFSQQVYATSARHGAVEWQAINDLGNREEFHGAIQ